MGGSLDDEERGQRGPPRAPLMDEYNEPRDSPKKKEQLREQQDSDVESDTDKRENGAMTELPKGPEALMAGSVQHTADKNRLATGIPKCEAAVAGMRVTPKPACGSAAVLPQFGICRARTDEHMMTSNLTRHMSADESLWLGYTEPSKLPHHSEAKVSEATAPYSVCSWDVLFCSYSAISQGRSCQELGFCADWSNVLCRRRSCASRQERE